MRSYPKTRALVETARSAAISFCETKARSAREIALGCDPGTAAAIGSSAAAAAYGAGAWIARRVPIVPGSGAPASAAAPAIEHQPAKLDGPRRALTRGRGQRQ